MTSPYKIRLFPSFTRFSHNPLMRPNPAHEWESQYVFNTAALYLKETVHFVYRAVGSTGLSVFGYAASQDGRHIQERLPTPIYRCQLSSTSLAHSTPTSFKGRNVASYPSGGSLRGCEDPRLTCIEETIYMTYTTFMDWKTPPGVALTSISVQDFLSKQWRWSTPQLISPPQEIHKNWVIFPEKIQGKFAILHSISPHILIDYVDTLEALQIKSAYHPVHKEEGWDNRIRGVGPPPLNTKLGWLVLYHAMDKKDPNQYKIGAMLLDKHEPTQVLFRSSTPLLEPRAAYENQGFKSGVIYSCGAALIGSQLFVYYGGADTVICGCVGDFHEFV